jgi:nucleotide-binding universal stress UspA family protein
LVIKTPGGEDMTEQTSVARIVVGVDGSPESDKAVAWAVGQAHCVGGNLELVSAWTYPTSYGVSITSTGFDPEGEANAVIAKAVANVDLPLGRITTLVVNESAAPALVKQTAGAALLVVGSRGHGGFENLLLGSVSTHCVHHAHCSVVVIR